MYTNTFSILCVVNKVNSKVFYIVKYLFRYSLIKDIAIHFELIKQNYLINN